MSKLGTYEPPRSQMTGLDMPVANIHEVVVLLQEGGFMVHPMDEQFGDEVAAMQGFYCGHGRGIVEVSICVVQDRSLPPFLNVYPCRSIFWRLLWPSDFKLYRQVVAWLMENGATRPATHC